MANLVVGIALEGATLANAATALQVELNWLQTKALGSLTAIAPAHVPHELNSLPRYDDAFRALHATATPCEQEAVLTRVREGDELSDSELRASVVHELLAAHAHVLVLIEAANAVPGYFDEHWRFRVEPGQRPAAASVEPAASGPATAQSRRSLVHAAHQQAMRLGDRASVLHDLQALDSLSCRFAESEDAVVRLLPEVLRLPGWTERELSTLLSAPHEAALDAYQARLVLDEANELSLLAASEPGTALENFTQRLHATLQLPAMLDAQRRGFDEVWAVLALPRAEQVTMVRAYSPAARTRLHCTSFANSTSGTSHATRTASWRNSPCRSRASVWKRGHNPDSLQALVPA